ncbi:MAG TPA: bifunctional biotin--[acetyl-CoA-carboxylase] ligase/biotin operon repressor BirA [Methylococcaceae bacterium]|nr:bifunctional biotin--[acetyl-CoA-carboxylase] ligase/biotin operon repressor BirA [Methylococcaceae bacterium]HIN67753.1 bifunctional biotin--[acetyl-CoA-carboxylase] ligase/biotin operon repressor BirA [Methylococcales bacterium]HIA45789.1 bifunctional biotin--[acetyl-CoA-carboxylase] ligase/biotin operon repressor BirA [Methylococcaceae bacterium]HIB62023.1 bifunctional biotin--[acetyl-CoA-carboxylase] ligase/biotin operon repressor BirA [Methylococcaceae bacterium]HIO13121.1 bifunctional 
MALTTTQRKILVALSDGQFHSGSDLSETLGISRSAICKQINTLDDLGLKYSAISGKGYRLFQAIELLDETMIRAHLSAGVVSQIAAIDCLDVVDSTNNYLLTHGQTQPALSQICLAEFQTAGRGRRGKQWVSPFGQNVYLSLSWQFFCGVTALAGLSLGIGVCLVRVIKALTGIEVGLKWPNDIFWQGKKLGGILVELTGDMEGPCSVVVGLGLNRALSDDEATAIDQDWVDLHRILGHKNVPRNKLIAELINELIPFMAAFEQEGIGALINEWRRYDCLVGQAAELQLGNNIISGTISGINDSGHLLLTQANGETQAYNSGEVSVDIA